MNAQAKLNQAQLVLPAGGNLLVWRVDKTKRVRIIDSTIGTFHQDHCYVILYSYQSPDTANVSVETFIFYWLGAHSTISDRSAAAILSKLMDDRSVEVKITEGFEPSCFSSLFPGNEVVVLAPFLEMSSSQCWISPNPARRPSAPPKLFEIGCPSPSEITYHEVKSISHYSAWESVSIKLLDTDSGLFLWVGSDFVSPTRRDAFVYVDNFLESAAMHGDYRPVFKIPGGRETMLFANVFATLSSDASPSPENEGAQDPAQQSEPDVQEALTELSLDEQPGMSDEAQGTLSDDGARAANRDGSFIVRNNTAATEVHSDPSSASFDTSLSSASSTAVHLAVSRQASTTESQPVFSRQASTGDALPGISRESSTAVQYSRQSSTVSATLPFSRQSSMFSESSEYKTSSTDKKTAPLKLYSYSELAKRKVDEVDPAKKEAYLEDEVFAGLFGMSKEAFQALPLWRQQAKKKELSLF